MANICIFLAEGFEEIEALTVVDMLRRAGQEVTMVSITQEKLVKGSHGIEVMANRLFSDMDFQQEDMLVLPGGMPGTKYLGAFEPLMELVLDFARKDKWVAAICAAPSLLGDLGLLEGKKAVCYPDFEKRLCKAKVSFEEVAQDGRIITARGMGCAIAFSLAIIEQLCSKEVALELKSGIIYEH